MMRAKALSTDSARSMVESHLRHVHGADVDKTPSREQCWLWTGDSNDDGKPVIGSRNALRVFRAAFYDDVVAGSFVVSKCVQKSCINPHHSMVLTRQQFRSWSEHRYNRNKAIRKDMRRRGILK